MRIGLNLIIGRLRNFRFRIERKKSFDVLFLRGGQVTELEPHLRSFRFMAIEPDSRGIVLHPIFILLLVLNLCRLSTSQAFLKTYVQYYKICVVIAFDNVPNSWDWAEVLERPLISIQHGMRQMQETQLVEHISANVLFLSWGELQIQDYALGRTPRYPNASHLRVPKEVIPCGSLRDSMYRNINYEGSNEKDRMCLISQFKGIDGHGLIMPAERQMNIDRLVEFLGRYVESRDLAVVVAVYSDTPKELEAEKEWFLERLGPSICFSDPTELFATYKTADDSEISFGIHTSVLWELFGRKKKIMACNFTGHQLFDFPVDGPWRLTKAGYSEFEDRVDYLRAMNQSAYESEIGEMANFLISYDSKQSSQAVISQAIAQQLAECSGAKVRSI